MTRKNRIILFLEREIERGSNHTHYLITCKCGSIGSGEFSNPASALEFVLVWHNSPRCKQNLNLKVLKEIDWDLN